MKKNILPIIIFFILMSQKSLANNIGDNKVYSSFCKLVTEAMTKRSDAKSRHEHIVKHFDEKVGSKEIKDAYDVIFQVKPDKRYSVFKNSIGEDIGGVWECSSLKAYFDQYVK